MTYSRLLSTLLFLGMITGLMAQISSGTIDYLETREFPMWPGASLEMKKRIQEAKERGDFDRIGRLTFNKEAFSYSQVPPEKGAEASGGWWSRQAENPDVFYTSLVDSTVTDSRQIMDRSFIMNDRWVIPDWEVPADQQANMAYTLPSEVAFAISAEGDTLTAYFTRSIPMGIGPQGYGGLPGAIVFLQVRNEGRITEYTMQTMKPNPSELDLSQPKEGDVIDRKEFEELKAKREEAMERRRRGWQRSRG